VSFQPTGKEREVKLLGRATIDGAPIAYIIMLAGVVTGLAFVPLSVVLGSGKSFPMSQGIYPLVGWILGPIAGAIASAIGASLGIFIAPYTTTVPIATVLGALMGSFAAGVMVQVGRRKNWWIPLSLLLCLIYGCYGARAIFYNGVRVHAVILGSFINGSALLLFIFPTRRLAARWIGDQNLRRVAGGLFLGTWIAAGLSHLTASTIVYFVVNWPEAVWLAMAPLSPLEHLARCVVGMILGTGVIAGLRAIGLVKPTFAVY